MKNSEHKIRIQNQIQSILQRGKESQAIIDRNSSRKVESLKQAEIQNQFNKKNPIMDQIKKI